MMRSLDLERSPADLERSPRELSARAQIASCAAALDSGLACLAAAVASPNGRAISLSVPAPEQCYWGSTSCPRQKLLTIAGSELLQPNLTSGHHLYVRPTSLLAPAEAVPHSYQRTPRWASWRR